MLPVRFLGHFSEFPGFFTGLASNLTDLRYNGIILLLIT